MPTENPKEDLTETLDEKIIKSEKSGVLSLKQF